jgi:hypothetical protein
MPIRYSTDADLAQIKQWLAKQERDGVETFHCNRNLTEEMHRAGRLLVYIDAKSKDAVAYQWGGLITPGVLEVKNVSSQNLWTPEG